MSLLPARMQFTDPIPALGKKVVPPAKPTPLSKEQEFERFNHDKTPRGADFAECPYETAWQHHQAEMNRGMRKRLDALATMPPRLVIDPKRLNPADMLLLKGTRGCMGVLMPDHLRESPAEKATAAILDGVYDDRRTECRVVVRNGKHRQMRLKSHCNPSTFVSDWGTYPELPR